MKYKYCRFCNGNGCIACPGEAKKDNAKKEASPMVPGVLLSIDPGNPHDMELLVSVFHRDKIEFAFEEGVAPEETARTGRGGGMQTIELEAAIARLMQKKNSETG